MDNVNRFAAGIAVFQHVRLCEFRYANYCIATVNLLLNMGPGPFPFIFGDTLVQKIEVMDGKKDPDIFILVWKDTAQLKRGMPHLTIPQKRLNKPVVGPFHYGIGGIIKTAGLPGRNIKPDPLFLFFIQ